ncbi:copper transport protein CTR2 [Ceratobasidium sp. AG-Ba]|nr:copper transport protein CTR2 [Ceratobasidium sp. AG-Ba]QRW06919.1 copper transport protein CTR2 [Ceratobasidium sp. AG-Ba]
MISQRQLTFALLALSSVVLAHGGAPETPSPDTSLSATTGAQTNMPSMMMMTPYFHWMGDADALYFKAWVPRSVGALIGACIGLFFLAVFERFLASAKGLMEAWWRRRQAAIYARTLVTPDNASTHSHSKSIESASAYLVNTPPPMIPAFEPVQDLARGGMQAVQSLIGFFLMLSVMTYNGAFLISVVLGLGVGEVVFARLGRSGAHPGCVAARTHG